MSVDSDLWLDARTAAEFKVNRALYLCTAGLAVVAGAGVILTFVLGAFHHVGLFLASLGVAFTFAFISIYTGAQGIRAIYKEGYSKAWSETTGKNLFNLQAIFLMLAALVTAVSPGVAYATAHDNSNPVQAALSAQTKATSRLVASLETLVETNRDATKAEIAQLMTSTGTLNSEIAFLRRTITILVQHRCSECHRSHRWPR